LNAIDDVNNVDDDSNARSSFGTKEYWDELYQGRGDFPAEEYTWYFDLEKYSRYVIQHVSPKDSAVNNILIPGIGNDPILLDLRNKGYKRQRITATDYSEHAIERQRDLLSQGYYGDDIERIELYRMDARKMPLDWANKFDAILEKGALDAIYLSGDGNFELAVQEFERVLRPGGILISVSGVVPAELRRSAFDSRKWNWIRDGSDDLEAGCFVFDKKAL
jgi:SAM-dependent methyltransferase